MAKEMGEGSYYADLNVKMAQFELTLLDWAENHKGARKYVAFADKCWPAFPSQFGFEPCYVNSRLASRGIPVSCEVDIYGALSEYIGLCISADAVTLLDINNSVPQYIYDEDIAGKYDYALTDTFMGFHCGNTPECKMCGGQRGEVPAHPAPPAGARQAARPTSPGAPWRAISPPADITFYRLQCDSATAELRLLRRRRRGPCRWPTRSFGGIGVSSRFPRWAASTAMCSSRSAIPHHGAVMPSPTAARPCSRY